ncbi:MAG: ApeP family dehydratase [Pseudomonadales bacterium]|mgnify:CR=1 FL=1|tara:strand:- start:1750 stop:2226 length:477 start_codon:yes stop_codon:yes gene_type:complete
MIELSTPCPIAPYVPHADSMCLLDTLLEFNADHLYADICPRADDLFADAQGIPGWVGIEWMAQAVAAWSGVQAVEAGQPPAVGFLLGSRRYEAKVAYFALGEPVRIEVFLDFRADNGLGAFRGQLLDQQGQLLASGTLNVYQPDSAEALAALHKGDMP